MGKVYEALLSAESADDRLDLDAEADDVDAIDVEDERGIRNPHGVDREGLDATPNYGRGFGQEIDADDERDLERNAPSRPARGPSSRFSFLRYSLGTGSVFDHGAPSRETSSALTR